MAPATAATTSSATAATCDLSLEAFYNAVPKDLQEITSPYGCTQPVRTETLPTRLHCRLDAYEEFLEMDQL